MRITTAIAATAVAAALAGCATEITSSHGRTVIVRAGFPDMGPEKATGLAEVECAKRGLSARVQALTGPTSDRYVFECVPAS